MKKIVLFNIFDLVGDTYLNSKPVMCESELAACMAFYNSFIKEKDPLKNPYGSKAVRLAILGYLNCNEDVEPSSFEKAELIYDDKQVVAQINKIMAERGVDDFIIDTEKENEE